MEILADRNAGGAPTGARHPLPTVTLAGAITLALLPAIAACGTDVSGTGSTAATRDSAGIAIVENTGQAWPDGRGWSLSAEPELRIGQIDEEQYQLFQVQGAVRLSDGRIVVANNGTHELRYYSETGAHLQDVGGRGGGPGEFQMLLALQRLPGDSVMTFDGQNRRLSIFGPSGRHMRDISLQTAAPAVFMFTAGRLANGLYIAQIPTRQPGPAMFERPAGRDRDSLAVLRLDSTGTVIDTVGIFPNLFVEVSVLQVGGRGLPFPFPAPFSPNTTVAVGATHLYVATSDAYEVRAYDALGAMQRIIRVAQARRVVTDRDIARDRERREEQLAQQPNPIRDEIRAAYDALDYPATMPAYAEVRVDAAGNLWVMETLDPERPERLWTVFDPAGIMLGRVAIPERVRVTDIGTDYVLGATRDDLDVEYVVMYRLVNAND